MSYLKCFFSHEKIQLKRFSFSRLLCSSKTLRELTYKLKKFILLLKKFTY